MGNKIIVILGPTASGKSDLAVKMAKKLNGEIISADSRQVYRGMDIGTGKITKKEMNGVPHYLLDVVSPKRRFTVSQDRKLAQAAIKNIIKKNRVPIICGGTAFYILALIDGIIIPEVKPDWKLRAKLEKLSADELYKKLKKLDPKRARTIESKNKRRLVRALEIITKTKKPIPPLEKNPLPCPVLILGVKKGQDEPRRLIRKRLKKRLKTGMIAEVKRLRKSLSWSRLDEFGLEYRYVSRYLQKKISYPEMVEQLQGAIENFSKRQMVWFKRDKRIRWVSNYKQAEKAAKNFLNKTSH